MSAELLLVDEPTVALPGEAAQEQVPQALVLTRFYEAGAERLMDHWSEPRLRRQWLSLPASVQFTVLAQAYPASLQATVSDGVHAALLQLFLEEEGAYTQLRLHIVPQAPLTRDMLIAAGYDDRWEELLYALADALTA